MANPTTIPFPKKPENWQLDKYVDGLDLAKKQYAEICERYILLGSPRQITLPNSITKPLAELMDMGYFHPDLLIEAYFLIFEKLLTESFHQFLEAQDKVTVEENVASSIGSEKVSVREISARELSARDEEEIMDQQSILNDDSFAQLPNASRVNTIVREGTKNIVIPNRVASARANNLAILTGSQSSLNLESSGTTTTIVKSPSHDVTIDKVLANLTAPPYSRKQYREFLEISKSEENLDFLVEVMAYQKYASRFYPLTVLSTRTLDMFENCNQLSQFTKPTSSEDLQPNSELDTIENIAKVVLDITNKYIKNQAPFEINLSSRIKKPLLMLIETGHYNPEIFTEAVTHIRDMLQQNGFDHFLKPSPASAISPSTPDGEL